MVVGLRRDKLLADLSCPSPVPCFSPCEFHLTLAWALLTVLRSPYLCPLMTIEKYFTSFNFYFSCLFDLSNHSLSVVGWQLLFCPLMSWWYMHSSFNLIQFILVSLILLLQSCMVHVPFLHCHSASIPMVGLPACPLVWRVFLHVLNCGCNMLAA